MNNEMFLIMTAAISGSLALLFVFKFLSDLFSEKDCKDIKGNKCCCSTWHRPKYIGL